MLLGSEFFRFTTGRRIYIPDNVYKWMAAKGPENFAITPLFFCPAHLANSVEMGFMRKWGVASLMNRDVPNLTGNKWSFLTERKAWKEHLASSRGSLHALARQLLDSPKPIPRNVHQPSLLLATLTITSCTLPAPQHRALFDKVFALFSRQFRVILPYRILVKIPLLTSTLRKQITGLLAEVVDRVPHWPMPLRTYIKARFMLISARTRTVGQLVLNADYQQLPTTFLEQQQAAACPCRRWLNVPGVHAVHGHAFFRAPAGFSSLPNMVCPSVFQQNLKNASIPAWKTFAETITDSVSALSATLPNEVRDRV